MRIRPGVIISIIAVFGVLFAGRYLGLFGGKPSEVAVETSPAEPPRPRSGQDRLKSNHPHRDLPPAPR